MDIAPILLKKPFLIPSLIAALMVILRIFFVFVNYVFRKVRRRREEEERERARAARRKAAVDSKRADAPVDGPRSTGEHGSV
jgi:flagellar biosynthesis/type III secretory pathway M-ring protein FliF/YscJ